MSFKSSFKRNSARRAGAKNGRRRYSMLGTILRCAVVVGVFTVAVLAGYIIVDCIKTVNGEAFDLDLYKTSQDQTSIIYIRENETYDQEFDPADFKEYKRLHGETNRIWIDFEYIPGYMKEAVIALEDKRFYEHHGVDWFRTLSVMVVRSNAGQGGSTITQQLIKNLTNKKEVTFVRKFNEILTALNLEKNSNKDEILETYLNTLYLGEGCYGIKTAAEVYFGKEVEDLTLAECAVLASITQAPGAYDPLINPDNNRERMELCLYNMLEQGFISQSEYNEALNYDLIFSNDERFVSQIKDDTENKEKEEIQSFYVDFIIASLIEDFQEEYDLTYNQAYKKVYYGGLRIYSAENVKAQDIAEEAYETRSVFPTVYSSSSTGEPVQSAITIMDYEGRVVAIVGAADKKAGNRCLNRASESPRQPGSSIKPLSCYAPAMENGTITAGSSYLDYSGTYRNGSPWPENYGGSYGTNTYVSIEYAVKQSLNTIPYRIINDMGLAVSYDFVKNKLHFSHLVDGQDNKDYAPLVTGGMYYGATTLEMSAGFTIFGSGGRYYDPYPYFKVTNSKGDVYFDNVEPDYEQVISPSCAEVMNRIMQTVVLSGGTGSGYGIDGFDTFAKTGTTSSDYDRWFVGGTPYYVASVWFGFDYPAPIYVSSLNPSGDIFYGILSRIHYELDLPYKDFDFVNNPQAELKSYCTYTGRLAGDSCYSDVAYFTAEYDTVCNGDHSGHATAADPDKYLDNDDDDERTTSSGNDEPTSNWGTQSGDEPGGSTGGDTGGSTGGDTGGSTGGDTGGSTGGDTGGSTGGDTGGSTGGDTGGSTGGDTGGSTGGDTGGSTGGDTGGGA